jgi:uncharacterized protein YkwD
MLGVYRAAVYRIYVLIATLVLATATLFVISIVEKNTASAQSTPSGGSVQTCSGGSLYLNAYEMRTYELHNQTRASNDLASLCVDETLTQAARSHSKEMMDKGYFSHESYNGESFSARLEHSGYNSYENVGENIAWGSGSYADPDLIFNDWLNSPAHRENILAPGYREVGIGTATGECEGYSDCTMYTVDFGLRSKSSAPQTPEQVATNPQGGVDDNEGGNAADNTGGGNATQGPSQYLSGFQDYILNLLRALGF